ncbi:hypothetical protein I545_1965 [Mycobacterium kansasii 662]|uniref:Uncharacterized protein n=1 Tax=Mycobacterium kansasii 662 TaxID=1299326 RepID=X7ZJT1_MYCKA|nr:hypothetical protein I547_3788 [Mycobacterium kansasii 824]EUA19842.1 hypothetical protein I545_1965 [Mycobacterium kansasii 662]
MVPGLPVSERQAKVRNGFVADSRAFLMSQRGPRNPGRWCS